MSKADRDSYAKNEGINILFGKSSPRPKKKLHENEKNSDQEGDEFMTPFSLDPSLIHDTINLAISQL